jgi:Spy/CpxP family protein refolding chaperone
MLSRKRLIQLGVVGVIGTGLLLAQRGGFGGIGRGHEGMREFLATYLDLTDAQKAQGKAIFENSRTAAQPVVEKLKAGHEEMAAAVKSGASDAELQAIANRQGALVGQMIGIHSQSMSKFYALLTPEQKEKADKLHDLMKERFQGRIGGHGPF